MIDIKTAHRRLDVIEATVKAHEEQLHGIRAALEKNTELTESVITNTGELVALFKGTKLVYKVFIGIATLVGMIIGAFFYIKEHMHL